MTYPSYPRRSDHERPDPSRSDRERRDGPRPVEQRGRVPRESGRPEIRGYGGPQRPRVPRQPPSGSPYPQPYRPVAPPREAPQYPPQHPPPYQVRPPYQGRPPHRGAPPPGMQPPATAYRRSAPANLYSAPSYFGAPGRRDDFESSFDRVMSGLGDIRHDDPAPIDDERLPGNGLAITGLVLSVLFDPLLLGLIFSIAGLVRATRAGAGTAMAWTGIAVSVVWLAVTIVYVTPALTG